MIGAGIRIVTEVTAILLIVVIAIPGCDKGAKPNATEEGGGTEAQARNLLKAGLDSWTFRDDTIKFHKHHPELQSFFEVDWAASKILSRYEITGARKSDSALDLKQAKILRPARSRGPRQHSSV